MIQVQTASRLHFGLLGVGAGDAGGRSFGSVGLMVKRPGVGVQVEPAAAWSADGPLAARALAAAARLAALLPDLAPQKIRVSSAAEHVGLGVGTQLELAVARALACAAGQAGRPTHDLARCLGRGLRSALGIHGFEHGGFLVDGGKHRARDIAPLLVRLPFPESWRLVLVVPPGVAGLHGNDEMQAFDRLGKARGLEPVTESLCRLVLLGLLPALVERDLEAFGEALYEFNRRVGEMFAPLQGGCYAAPLVVDLVRFLRRQGVRGVGQSSWGPAVFGVVESEEQGTALLGQMSEVFGLEASALWLTLAANAGAEVTCSPHPGNIW